MVEQMTAAMDGWSMDIMTTQVFARAKPSWAKADAVAVCKTREDLVAHVKASDSCRLEAYALFINPAHRVAKNRILVEEFGFDHSNVFDDGRRAQCFIKPITPKADYTFYAYVVLDGY